MLVSYQTLLDMSYHARVCNVQHLIRQAHVMCEYGVANTTRCDLEYYFCEAGPADTSVAALLNCS